MKHYLKTLGVAALVVVVGLVAYAVGYTQAYWRGTDRLKYEAQGNLSAHIEELARLRTGDTSGAERLLESSVDESITTIPMGKPFAAQAKMTQQVLSAAKVYRRSFPSESATVNAALGDVPPLPVDHAYCSPALSKVAKLGPQSAGS